MNPNLLFYGGQPLNPADFVFESGRYFLDQSLTALQSLNNIPLTLKGQGMFFAIMQLMATSTGAFRASFYVASSERYTAGTLNGTTDKVRGECLYGTAQRPGVLEVPIIIPASASIMHDVEDVSNATNALHLVYSGARMYRR